MRTLGVLFLAGTVLAQGHNRTENRALLGIVATPAPKDDAIVIAHVLDKSPAKKAGLKAGDELLSIAGRKIAKPEDVDAALAGYSGSDNVDIEYRREKKKTSVRVRLVNRAKYRGDFLKRSPRGRTGFKAPE